MSFTYTYNYDHNQNSNSTTAQEEEEEFPPFSLFSFPSPFLDENSLFLGHKATDQTQQPNLGLGLILNKPLLENIPTQQQDSTRRRYSTRKNGKKDRHSKIHTSKGFRDRRMRLSLEIARKFFDLQDRLGFDKASKTIDWLFSKSEKAIRKLRCSSQQITNNAANLMSSERAEKSQEKIKRTITEEGEYSCVVSAGKISEKSITKITKEFRAKARAKARERTRENMLMRCLEKLKDENLSAQPYKLAQLGPEGNPNSLFEIGQESTSNSSSTRDEHISTNSQSVLHRPLANVEIVENLMSSTTTSSSGSASSCYGYQQNDELFAGGGLYSYSNNLSFLGNWDIDQFQILLKHGPDLDSKNS